MCVDGDLNTKRWWFWLCGAAAAASVCNQSVSIFFSLFLRRSNNKMRNLLLPCVAALTDIPQFKR